MHVELAIWGDTLVSRKLDRLADRTLSARPGFEAIGKSLRGYERRLFDSQGASGGAPWKPLSPTYVSHKKRAGLDPRVLRATEALRKSLTNKSDTAHLELATDRSLVFGSFVKYGAYHQNPKNNSRPRRRPMQFTEPQKRRIVKRLQTYVMTGDV